MRVFALLRLRASGVPLPSVEMNTSAGCVSAARVKASTLPPSDSAALLLPSYYYLFRIFKRRHVP